MVFVEKKSVGDVGEPALLAAIARRLGRPFAGVRLGVGDDAALLERIGPQAVLTADMLVEGVDFSLDWAGSRDVGHKAAAVNLSDLAGMGARPRALLLSLGLRREQSARDALALVTAVDALGRRFGAPLVGGDLSATTGPMVVAVTAVGEVKRPLLRHRGRSGDVVMVSGSFGGAAAGLAALMAGRASKLAVRQLRPTPRISLGQAVAALARSGADVSDGLFSDAQHVAGDGCTVRLDAARVPVQPGATLEQALTGGEDFELVLAVAPGKVGAVQAAARRLRQALTVIGEVVQGKRPLVSGYEGPLRGYEHFSSTSTSTDRPT